MPARPEDKHVAARHGRWGENVAAAYLERNGYRIVDRNVRPCRWDARYELDIVARAPDRTLVFVEVKQSAEKSKYAARLHRITRHKMRLLRIAANAYRLRADCEDGYRFDAIEVYGVPERGVPEVDHIEGLQVFVPQDRFVRWN